MVNDQQIIGGSRRKEKVCKSRKKADPKKKEINIKKRRYRPGEKALREIAAQLGSGITESETYPPGYERLVDDYLRSISYE